MSFDGRDPRDWDVAPEGFTVRKVKREDLPLRYPQFAEELQAGNTSGIFKRYWVSYRQDMDWDSFANG